MSVADAVAAYVNRRPYIQEALRQGIINYAALARRMESEINGSFEAIKIALRRLKEEITDEREKLLDDAGSVLDVTAIKLQNRISVCKTTEKQNGELYAKTESGYTYIQEQNNDCTGTTIDDMVLITLRSPIELEETAGVLSLILQVLEGHDINVAELISCREDTHLVVAEKDAAKAFRLLNETLSQEMLHQ